MYMVRIQPASKVIDDLFKKALDQTIELLTINSDWDPINTPYAYGNSDLQGKTPIKICMNPDYLAMLLDRNKSDGYPLVTLRTAQDALNESCDVCKQKLQHFIDFETVLNNHSDITPFKEEALKNIRKLLAILNKWQNEQAIEDSIIARIHDQLHALLVYEVSDPQRGDSGKITAYLKVLAEFRELLQKLGEKDLPLLVNESFPYGAANVKDKTPMDLAQQNTHPRCLKYMENFLKEAQ